MVDREAGPGMETRTGGGRTGTKLFVRLARNMVAYGIMEDHKLFTCTGRFQERDFDFLAAVMSAGDDHGAFRRYVADREELCALLDDRRVLDALLVSPTLLNVSPWFYFYVLVRHSLLRGGLDDIALAEYVGVVLAGRTGLRGGPRAMMADMLHSVDFLQVLESASGDRRFELLVAGGNQFLILTGVFRDFVERRRIRRGSPGIRYYENVARASFQEAQEHRLAVRGGIKGVLGTLTEALPETRRSLNRMADSLLFLAS